MVHSQLVTIKGYRAMLSNTFCHLGLWDVELNKDLSHHLANLSCTWLVYYLLPVLESWVGPYQLNSFLIKPLLHASFKLPTWKTCLFVNGCLSCSRFMLFPWTHPAGSFGLMARFLSFLAKNMLPLLGP